MQANCGGEEFDMNRVRAYAVLIFVLSAVEIINARKMPQRGVMKHQEEMPKNGESSSEAGKIGPYIEELGSEFGEIMESCNASFPFPIEYLSVLNITGELPPEAKPDAKCFLDCIGLKMKIFDEKGNIVPENFSKWRLDKIDNGSQMRAAVKCSDYAREKVQDPCEVSYERLKCMFKEDMKANS